MFNKLVRKASCVLECSWEKLIVDNSKSKDLDDIIFAHDSYLQTLLDKSLLNIDQMALLNKYRILLNLIFEFAALHENFVDELFEISNDRKSVNPVLPLSEIKEVQLKIVVKAAQISRTFKANLNNLLEQYRNCLREFLISLTAQDQENWRLLSFRLDFSQFYRSSYGPALDESLTFSGRRRIRRKKVDSLEILH
uniref:Gamma-tubulin complex component n=1 Tax=Romanomermis culicivorax TaxID=13658 RepID=A0A915JCW1_ROMCU